MKYPHLFSPMKIGNVELKNRIVYPPMGPAYLEPGRVSEQEIKYFEERAKGGIGLLITGGYAVGLDYCGRASNPTLEDPSYDESIKEMIDRVHKYDAKIMFQLMHQGRQASSDRNNGQQPVAPSAIKEAEYMTMPRELSVDEIKEIVQCYINAAKKAYDLGADGVELHGAHGYLIHEFMSPRANHRTDEYGGSFERRMRFAAEIVQGINAIKPADRMLAIRINGTDNFENRTSIGGGGFSYRKFADRTEETKHEIDWYEDGITITDGLKIALYLEKVGIDAIDISTTTYSVFYYALEPAIMDEGSRSFFVKPIKEKLKIPVIAVNNVKRPETAEILLEEGICDFVSVGRSSIADPQWANKAYQGKDTSRSCIGCLSCMDNIYANGLTCAMNPYTGRELKYNEDTLNRNGNGRHIVVIGGGPGGLEAALTAAKRGFSVILFEKSGQLGGALSLASKGKGKNKITWALNGMINEVKEAGVKIQLNTEITDVEQIKSLDPYAVVIAVGGTPIKPQIPGLDGNNVYLAHDILTNDITFENKKIAIVGSGMTGLETAEILTSGDNDITIYDMLDTIAKGTNDAVKTLTMDYLVKNGVQFKTDHKLMKVNDSELVFEDLTTGSEIREKADIIAISLGIKRNESIEKALTGEFENLIVIGDCSADGGKIYQATRDAMLKVWDI